MTNLRIVLFQSILALQVQFLMTTRQCVSTSSKYGFISVGSVFKSSPSESLHLCYITCQKNPVCQSLNYNAAENVCELSTEMSRSRPENFQQRKMLVYAEKLPDLRWKRITKSWIDSALTGGVTLTYDEENNGLTISGRVTSSGCGSAPPSGALTLIKGYWTMIKYTQEFRGRSSCWSIFGDEWYGGLYISNTSTGLYPFNAKAGDVITDEYRMGLNSHAFDGKTRRCDKLATNFWRSQKGLRRATVVLRRKPMAEKAGIFTGTSCGTPTYKIRDIYVYF